MQAFVHFLCSLYFIKWIPTIHLIYSFHSCIPSFISCLIINSLLWLHAFVYSLIPSLCHGQWCIKYLSWVLFHTNISATLACCRPSSVWTGQWPWNHSWLSACRFRVSVSATRDYWAPQLVSLHSVGWSCTHCSWPVPPALVSALEGPSTLISAVSTASHYSWSAKRGTAESSTPTASTCYMTRPVSSNGRKQVRSVSRPKEVEVKLSCLRITTSRYLREV